MDFLGKKVLVVGMKASGVSVGYLLRDKGADVYCYDDDKRICFGNFIFIPKILKIL